VLPDTQLEISEPDPAAPDLGCLVVNVDISPSCDIYAEDRVLQAESTKTAGQLQRMLSSSGGLDLKQFCILSGLYCWTVHVDLLVVLATCYPSLSVSDAIVLALSAGVAAGW
jgi:exosome complex RNA-binding protein Rrp42 (RNase PH superfamily)